MNRKRMISLVLAVTLTAAPVLEIMAAEETEEGITSIEDADRAMAAYDDESTEWEEVYLDSAEDMKAFAKNCWLDTWSVNKKVYLTEDIDLTDSDFVSIPTFGGYFDGRGHTISGLAVRDEVSYIGLFCYTQQSAVIANLKVRGNVHPAGKSMVVGGIVGNNRGIIMNCMFDGRVGGNDYVGGIVGFNEQSGIVIDCGSAGKVTGTHYTGGIAGENTGNLVGCINKADVNVSNEDRGMSLEDINLEQYAADFLEAETDDGKPGKASVINNTIDTGGIVGLSTGIVQFCGNEGTVGYEHVGYNTGGIAGRQSGYVHSCENTGAVYGRKDVGGIVGQTEPYVAVDLSEDIAYQLSENIDKLHDLTGRMLDDAGAESDTVSARLTVIQDFVDKALEDTDYLADRTIEWTDDMVGSANDMMGRVDYIMDETARSGGFMDQTRSAAGNVRDAAEQLGNTVDALDIYQYMSAEEKALYEESRDAMQDASTQYAQSYEEALKAYRNYYIDKVRSDPQYGYTRDSGFSLYVNTDGNAADGVLDDVPGTETPDNSKDNTMEDKDIDANESMGDGSDTDSSEDKDSGGDEPEEKDFDVNGPADNGGNTVAEAGGSGEARQETEPETGADENVEENQGTRDTGNASVKDLRPIFENTGLQTGWVWNIGNTYEDYIGVTDWVHYNAADQTTTTFPQADGAQGDLDRQLLEDVAGEMADAANAIKIESDATAYANEKYMTSHPASSGYQQDMKDYLQVMSDLVLAAGAKMSEEAQVRLRAAVGHVEDAMGNLQSAGSDVKNIFDTVNGMGDIQLPQLGGDYRSRAGSLNANLQGLSENMGHLNDEMASTNDTMLADLSEINDQFSVIMRLYTDAIDGVLDMDYSAVYEDNSQEDAESSVDATVADCRNKGVVRGDLNVSGIAGTMAIEYDFDLEGDVTGIENARWNSTFLTKCVLRKNVNEGNITAQKSYAGGIAGLQEMGTILECENYGRIGSSTGNYVGGIAGQSLSCIASGYAKCTVFGEEYVAGIAGSGSGMENCCAMVRIQDAAAFYGAIAGDTDGSGTVAGNYFVSDEVAGIDRISYSGKAEPIPYEEMLAVEGLPDQFRMMSVVFYADEEEVKKIACPYNSDVLSELYPDIPAKEGFYADWDIREIRNIVYDEDVTAEYVRYLTTLASAQTRENGQSALLADGMFRQEEKLEINHMPTEEVPLKDVAERWHIFIPEDGKEAHQLRYQAPQGETEGVDIYIRQDGAWRRTETELMGMYYLFPIEGNEAEIAVCVRTRNLTDYLLYGIPAAVAAVAALVLLIRKSKHRQRKHT